MDFCGYTVTAGGNMTLTLPCFFGEEDACRMNRFYDAAMAELYGMTLTENERRAGFFCRFAADEDDGIVTVRLELTYRRPGAPSVRKTVVHRWRDGFLLRERKSPV